MKAGDFLSIAYAGVAVVPFSPWTLVAIAVALALLAVTVMKTRGQTRVFASAFAVMLGGAAVFTSGPVQARIQQIYPLPDSGEQIPVTQTGSYTIAVRNETGEDITITAINYTPSPGFQRNLDRPDRCLVGLTLADDAICTITARPIAQDT